MATERLDIKATPDFMRLRWLDSITSPITSPEYFYQQPSPQQERKFREDYLICRGWARTDNVRIPQTINTYFGKVEFIQEELHFRDFCKSHGESPGWTNRFKELRKKRQEAFARLNSLSREEVEELKSVTAGKPLQVVDITSGNLYPFPA